jgi:hypothetical protein
MAIGTEMEMISSFWLPEDLPNRHLDPTDSYDLVDIMK